MPILGHLGRWAGGFDSDAADYFSRISAAGSSISAANKSAVDVLVRGLKEDGIWSAIKACCLLAGPDDLTGALVPLVGPAPTNNNFVEGDYSRTTGLVGDGSTKYLDSNRLNTDDPPDDCHVAVRFTQSQSRDTTRSPIGSYSGVGGTFVSTNITTSYARISSSNGLAISSTAFTGLFAGQRIAFNEVQMFQSNNLYAGTSNSETRMPTMIQVFARSGSVFSDARISYYSIGESLDLALLDARLTSYMATLT